MDPVTVILLLLGGVFAGFVNTVAGGGSIVTLPILIEVVGLPATVANGTNRIAILLQNVAGVRKFRKGGVLPARRVLPLIPPIIIGAVAGAWSASQISPEVLKKVFAFVLVLVAVSVLAKPKKWLKDREEDVLKEPWRSLAFLGIGFYGGFVQAGVGFLLLAGLVLGGGLDLVRGNAAKVLLVLIYTPVTLLVFLLAGQVEWLIGLILAVGNMTGAHLAASLAIAKGAGWIRWVLVVAAVAAAARMLLA